MIHLSFMAIGVSGSSTSVCLRSPSACVLEDLQLQSSLGRSSARVQLNVDAQTIPSQPIDDFFYPRHIRIVVRSEENINLFFTDLEKDEVITGYIAERIAGFPLYIAESPIAYRLAVAEEPRPLSDKIPNRFMDRLQIREPIAPSTPIPDPPKVTPVLGRFQLLEWDDDKDKR